MWSKASKVPRPPPSNSLDESMLALLGEEMDEGSMATDRPSRGQKSLGKQPRNDGGGLTCFSASFTLPILGSPITLSSESDSTNNNGGQSSASSRRRGRGESSRVNLPRATRICRNDCTTPAPVPQSCRPEQNTGIIKLILLEVTTLTSQFRSLRTSIERY